MQQTVAQVRGSDFIAKPRQVLADFRFQPGALGELLAQGGGKAGHLFLEGLAVFFLRGDPNVAAGTYSCLRISSSVAALQKQGMSA